jgi:regulator of replication initiation timing
MNATERKAENAKAMVKILMEENKRMREENALLRKIQAVQDESLEAAMDIKDIALKEIRGRG